MVDSQYVLPNDIGIADLDCAKAFQLLLPEERLYAHYMSRACWYGGLVVLLQTSPEAPAIYALISRLFRVQEPARLGELAHSLGLSDEEYQVPETLSCSKIHLCLGMLECFFCLCLHS